MLTFLLLLLAAFFVLILGVYLIYFAILGAKRRQRVNWRAVFARGCSYGLSLAVFNLVTYLSGKGFELLQDTLGTITASLIGYVSWFIVFFVMGMIVPVPKTKPTIPGAMFQACILLLLLAFMHVLSVLVLRSSLDSVFRIPLIFVLVTRLGYLPFFTRELQPFYSK